MDDAIEIRAVKNDEIAAVLELVGTVADEIYCHLFAEGTPLPVDPEPRKQCRIAIVDGHVAGVVLTTADIVEDLWLLKQYRGRRIGSQLLAQAESQILEAGFTVGKLRVVSDNDLALRFYQTRDWKAIRHYPHEKFGFEMVDMEKCLSN